MLDGRLLIDAHVHAPNLGTLRPAWRAWAHEFGAKLPWPELFDSGGAPIPELMDAHFAADGVDAVLLFAEYSPKATGIQPIEDYLPLVVHNPRRFRLMANINPHLHFPPGDEVARQVSLGAVGLKLHPVHAGFSVADTALYPAYQVCREAGIPVVIHCGTSTFPGSNTKYADPELLDDVLRDFPDVNFVLAHGGRGWWYDAAAFLALSRENVWIELSGLPPKRLAEYYAKFDLARLARKFIFGTDWPGMPGVAKNARAIADLGWDEATIADVWAGNAMRVYPALADLAKEI
ncbi:MAG: amidohydrolase family protein [Sporichthyaceae bacterium]